MTNTEYFNSIIPELSPDLVGAILVYRNLTGTDEYAINKDTQLAEADILMRGVLLPEFSEGALSIKYNTSEMKRRANEIYKEYGDARYNDGQPKIKRFKLG